MMLEEIVTKRDLNNFKNELIKEFSQLQNNRAIPNKWLKSVEVQELLNISAGTLQTLRINRTLPFTKLGKTIFYDYNDILKILESNKSN